MEWSKLWQGMLLLLRLALDEFEIRLSATKCL
jgi:hypothetical protein